MELRQLEFFVHVAELGSFTRASNSRWRGVCGAGMNSSLETDCTGMGEANSDSAAERRASSSGDSMLIGWTSRQWQRRQFTPDREHGRERPVSTNL